MEIQTVASSLPGLSQIAGHAMLLASHVVGKPVLERAIFLISGVKSATNFASHRDDAEEGKGAESVTVVVCYPNLNDGAQPRFTVTGYQAAFYSTEDISIALFYGKAYHQELDSLADDRCGACNALKLVLHFSGMEGLLEPVLPRAAKPGCHERAQQLWTEWAQKIPIVPSDQQISSFSPFDESDARDVTDECLAVGAVADSVVAANDAEILQGWLGVQGVGGHVPTDPEFELLSRSMNKGDRFARPSAHTRAYACALRDTASFPT